MAADVDVDVAVVGAGVVGLACAAALARAGRTVVVLERNAGVGQETTSRNSEVVHAGIYYPAGLAQGRALCEAGATRSTPVARHGGFRTVASGS